MIKRRTPDFLPQGGRAPAPKGILCSLRQRPGARTWNAQLGDGSYRRGRVCSGMGKFLGLRVQDCARCARKPITILEGKIVMAQPVHSV